MHPKTQINGTLSSIEKILKAGWAGQAKINGHRAQIHISANHHDHPIVYNRQGRSHKQLLTVQCVAELRRILPLEVGWTVIDAEWIKPVNKLYIFDLLKLNNASLRNATYQERWQLLPRFYLSGFLQTLPLLMTVNKCWKVLYGPEKYIEGLVFKSLNSKGFEDTAIIRCRKTCS